MRLSELGGKEIVDYRKAARLGVLGQTDLEIDIKTGQINNLIIPSGKWMGVEREAMKLKCHGILLERSVRI